VDFPAKNSDFCGSRDPIFGCFGLFPRNSLDLAYFRAVVAATLEGAHFTFVRPWKKFAAPSRIDGHR